MWLIIYILLWIFNLMYTLSNRTNRFVSFFSYLMMAMVFVLNDGTTGDAHSYRVDFVNNAFGADWSEPGYYLFKSVLKMMGITTYRGLLIAIFLISSVLIIIGLKYFRCSYNTMLAMTMPFIFPTCAVAVRFFMSIAIMIFSLRFLVQKRVVLYVACVVVATLFHRTALIYLILLFGASDRTQLMEQVKRIGNTCFAIISLVVVIVTGVSGRLPFIDDVAMFASSIFSGIDAKIKAYTGSMTHFGAYLFFIIYFIGLLFAIYMKKQIHEEDIENFCKDVRILDFAKINYNIQLLLSVVLPFIVLNLVFYRILILGFITNAILFGMYAERVCSTKSLLHIRVNKGSFLFLCSCIMWFVPEIIGINSITIQGLINVSIESFF